jgi:ABC-type glycerol-3-phosphate transport system substrate-binding protein
MKKFLTAALAVTALFAAGCGGGRGKTSGPVTITFYPAAGNLSSGVMGGYRGEQFSRRGFNLDVWAYSDEKTNAILASGDLPDVMFVPDVHRDVMIEGGMLLDLDAHLDRMPHAKSYPPLPTALNYVRKYKSAGTGGLYGLPTVVGDNSTKATFADSTERNALKLRWDVYEEIGAPAIKNIWDVLDVMELMLKARPVEPDGNPNYGTVLNNGSDTNSWACMTLFYAWQGYSMNDLPYLLETNLVTGEHSSILDANGLYYQGLRWYNAAYKRGLMDPDSINLDRPIQKVKVDSGYVMIPSGNLPGWAAKYYEYYIPGTKVYYSYTSLYGGQLIGVSAKTKNLDAALAFLDTLCDPDAFLANIAGPDGDFWESDGKGGAFFTERGMEYVRANGRGDGFTFKNGEKFELWNTPWVVTSGADTTYLDGEGTHRIPYTQQWRETNEISGGIPIFQQWQKTTGYKTWKDWLASENAYYSKSPLDGVYSFCEQPDDDMRLTLAALRDAVVTASWRMVYAKSDAEFRSVWDRMIADCGGLGAEKIIAWRLADLAKARAARDSLL